jgi:hypothetical protein
MAKGLYRFSWRKKRIPLYVEELLPYRSEADKAKAEEILRERMANVRGLIRIRTAIAISAEDSQGRSALVPKGLL